MFKELVYNGAWILPNYLSYHLFNKSIKNVSKTQEKVLLSILKNNKDTPYGKHYRFSKINNVLDFQRYVKISSIEDYRHYVNNNIKLFVPTSGSTSKPKYIPYTNNLKKQFHKGIFAWMFDTYLNNKSLFFGKIYFSITPEIKKNQKIGFEDDSDYFGRFRKCFLSKLFVVPKEVKLIQNTESFQYTTLLFLLKEKNLRFISIWSPSFLTILLKNLPKWYKSILGDIKGGTISARKGINKDLYNTLKGYLKKDLSRFNELQEAKGIKDIWNNLTLVSCWGDSSSSFYVDELKELLPDVKIQLKGLISTEGFISFPISNYDGHILSIQSHFFEFMDCKSKDIRLAYELELNKEYQVIITTDTLYRYDTKDIIKVCGFRGDCPLIVFLGRVTYTDLFGEKLSEQFISEVCSNLFNKYNLKPKFFMIAPEVLHGDYYYTLFIDTLQKISMGIEDDFEFYLRKNYHYTYCRKLGQLSKAKVMLIRDGEEKYYERLKFYEIKLGNIKNRVLDNHLNWSDNFKTKSISKRMGGEFAFPPSLKALGIQANTIL